MDAIRMDLPWICHGSAFSSQVIFDGPVDALWIEPGVAEGSGFGQLEDLH